MYDRLKDLLLEGGTLRALQNTNAARSKVLKRQPGAKRDPNFSTRMGGTLTRAARAQNRLAGKETTQSTATDEPAKNRGGTKATTITVRSGPKYRA